MMLMNLGAILVMAMSAGPADPTGSQGHGHGHDAHANHGNPADFDRYVAKLEDPERDAWQKPDEVVAALRLSPGQVVCDIGVGTGYFARRFAAAVGPTGRVFGVDVEPRMLAALAQRLDAAGIRNVTPVMGLPADPLLPASSCDLIVVVDTYHHFPDGPAYLRRLGDALKPSGRLVNIDFHKRELPVGPPVDHLVARADFLADAGKAGFTLKTEHTMLPHQYFLVLQRAPAPSK